MENHIFPQFEFYGFVIYALPAFRQHWFKFPLVFVIKINQRIVYVVINPGSRIAYTIRWIPVFGKADYPNAKKLNFFPAGWRSTAGRLFLPAAGK
jgi:hypothetical protein